MVSVLKKLFSLLPSTDKVKLLILFIMMLVGALLEVVGVGMIPVFVSIIAAPQMLLEYDRLAPLWFFFGIDNDGDLLVYGSLLLICVYAVKNAYTVFSKYIQARFIWGRYAMIGQNLFRLYMKAPYEFHLNRNSSELLRNVTHESLYLAKHIMTPLLKLMMDAVLVMGIFAMLLWVEPLITLMVFILLGGGGGLFLKLIKERIRQYGLMAQKDRGSMIKVVNEGLQGFKDVRVLNRENWFTLRFGRHVRRYARSQTFRELASQATKPVIETIAVSGMLMIGLMLYWQGKGVATVIPILTLFGAATIRLLPAIQEAAKSFTDLRYYIYSVEPVYNDTNLLRPKVEGSKDKGSGTLDFQETIQFKHVTYSYPRSEVQAVSDLTLTIPKGQAVGFVGTSGAGKTTVVDLLLGFLTPQHGEILVDGRRIHSNITEWQKNIGYIPQFIFLADDTIRRNIALGLPDEEIEDDKLQAAVEAAQLTGLVDSLPEGVDTVIGERGTRLSGGQRQRIGIARALYHNPDVLILDEATSALDNTTEKYVIEAIERLKGERTIIMIAHRLTSVQGCDVLHLMKDGKIISSGSYEMLFDDSGEYKKDQLKNR